MAKFTISKAYLQNLLSVTTKHHERAGSAVDMIHIYGDRIYATDGHCLLSYKIYPIEPLPQQQYTIPSTEIKALIKAGKGMIEVDLDLLSDMSGNRISYSSLVPSLTPVAVDEDTVNLIETSIDNALGTYIFLKTHEDVAEDGKHTKGLTITSGCKNQWCVAHLHSSQLADEFPLIELALDVSKLDILVEELTWNQIHVTNYSAPVVFSDSRGGTYAEMIFLIMPVEIRDRTYLDVALANAI